MLTDLYLLLYLTVTLRYLVLFLEDGYSDAAEGITMERRAYAEPATVGDVAWDLQ